MTTSPTPDLLPTYRAASHEYERLSDLMRRHKLKTFADIRNLHTARDRYVAAEAAARKAGLIDRKAAA